MTSEPKYDRDLRVALAMNGGVSLAVWIGGAVGEFYRASRGEGLYGGLAKLTRQNVVIDILTGASAGGLNGAFVAAATAGDLNGSTFDELRDVWLQAGSFKNLLRDSGEKDAPSLLRGDAYFMKQVETVLSRWLGQRSGTEPPDALRNLDLVLSATTLDPARNTATDAVGNRLVDPQYRARFTFTADHLWTTKLDLLARQLARAARTSASFPGAFEASYVQVGPSTTDPDMTGVASFNQSMWAIDGGVLLNKPIGPAFELIERKTSARDGRRVLVYVNPDPGTPIATPPADRTAIPTMISVIGKALVSIPRQESIAADLAQINQYNRRFGLKRRTRESLLLGIPVGGATGGDSQVRLEETAELLYPVWLRRDGIQMADEMVSRHLALISQTFDDRIDRANATSATWTDATNAIRLARGRAQWLSGTFPTSPELRSATTWQYGMEAVRYLCSTVIDLTRRALDVLPFADPAATGQPEPQTAIAAARADVYQIRDRLDDLGRRSDAYQGRQMSGAPSDQTKLTDWATKLWSDWPGPGESAAELEKSLLIDARRVVAILTDVAPKLSEAANLGTAWRIAPPGLDAVPSSASVKQVDRRPDVLRRLVAAAVAPGDVLRRLLAVYVIQDATTDVASSESRLQFLQLSADRQSPLAPTRLAADKVRGLDIGHFGGFVKASWRANDWMWGCLDGAAQVAALLLDPDRLAQIYPSSTEFINALSAVLSGQDSGPEGPSVSQLAELTATWTPQAVRDRVGTELGFLDDKSSPPTDLPETNRLVGMVIQQIVAARELPSVADGIEQSKREHALVPDDAQAFLAAIEPVRQAIPLAKTQVLLDKCKVGSETAKAELKSDALAKVVANVGAVATGALSGKNSGLGKLRPLLRGVHTVLSAVNIMVQSALEGTRAALAAMMTLLAVGGGLIGAKLLGADVATGPLVLGIAFLTGFVLLVGLIVSVGRALASVGVVTAIFALSSIDANAAGQLCCDPNHPGWKPWLHGGGAIGLLLVGLIAAWCMKRPKAAVAGLIAGSIWSIAGWLVRHKTGQTFVDVMGGIHAWRAVWIVAAIPIGAAIASLGTKLFSHDG